VGQTCAKPFLGANKIRNKNVYISTLTQILGLKTPNTNKKP